MEPLREWVDVTRLYNERSGENLNEKQVQYVADNAMRKLHNLLLDVARNNGFPDAQPLPESDAPISAPLQVQGKKGFMRRVIARCYQLGMLPPDIQEVFGVGVDSARRLYRKTMHKNAPTALSESRRKSGRLAVGVTKAGGRKKCWVAAFTVRGVTHRVGYFHTEQEAADALAAAKLEFRKKEASHVYVQCA